MKKWITLCLVALMGLGSFGLVSGKENARLNGKTSQINQEAKTFVLKTENETWKVIWDEQTNFVFDGKKVTSTDLKEDIEVLVAGKPAEAEKIINAVTVAWGKKPDSKDPGKDRQIPNIFGKLSELNLTDKTFKLEAKDREGNPVVFTVTYLERTSFIRDKKQAKPEDFKDGEEVTVAGKVNPEEKTVLAMAVALGKMKLPPGKDDNDRTPMVFGKMTGFNLTDKTFNLELKDKDGNPIIFAVTYGEKTTFIRDKKQAKPEDFKDGEEVTVAGRINREDKKIIAVAVMLGKVEIPDKPGDRGPDSPPGAPYQAKGVQGLVTEINLEKLQFTMEARGQVVITVQFHDWTDFVRNGLFVIPKALGKGDKITVFGPIDTENKTIDAHYVVW